MINVDVNNLNELEKHIHSTLKDYAKENERFNVHLAAQLCGCSASKISKFVKKIGFTNFKQYLDFLYGMDLNTQTYSSELTRIQHFINDFDSELTDELLKLIESHNKIIFFGYGPSLLCAQYFEYRFRTCTKKNVMAVSDEISVNSMVDDNTLLVILTVTGSFRSFEHIYHDVKKNGCDVVIIVEEYNTLLFDQCDKIFWLSKYTQPKHLEPYEKSRTIFFIFLEEVIQRFLEKNFPSD